MLSLGIFLLLIPSLVIGTQFSGECLGMWWHRMIFLVDGAASPIEMSVGGWSHLRLLTDLTPGRGTITIITTESSWPLGRPLRDQGRRRWALMLLAALCRTKTARSEGSALGEFAGRLDISSYRSEAGSAHCVILLPITYLVSEFFSPRVRPRAGGDRLLGRFLQLDGTTSTDPGLVRRRSRA